LICGGNNKDGFAAISLSSADKTTISRTTQCLPEFGGKKVLSPESVSPEEEVKGMRKGSREAGEQGSRGAEEQRSRGEKN
jgi:hypothetical protein